ncbi:hypothetical protein D515_03705 [Grimontia indica]|uniref:Uncharacterized protein n=1 Tax=Grimontia indica TaxID=1056512 RepID=R1IA18_9GAMM|nr:hypothetical protein D515_03705 [Grimontia indica]
MPFMSFSEMPKSDSTHQQAGNPTEGLLFITYREREQLFYPRNI